MARTLLAIAALALIAASCGPGPLPTIPPRQELWQDRFPTTGETPLDLDVAIRSDKLDDVRRLLDAGADPNMRWCPFESRGSDQPGWLGCTSEEGMEIRALLSPDQRGEVSSSVSVRARR